MSSLGKPESSLEHLSRTPLSTDESIVSEFEHLAIAVSDKDDHKHEGDVSAAAQVQVRRKPLPREANSQQEEVADASPEKQSRPSFGTTQHTAGLKEPPRVGTTSNEHLRQSLDSSQSVAAPVVQEVNHVHKHEIRHELVHRDIHEYHEVTRILPVVERTVLPARHFIETLDGRKVEIPAPAESPHVAQRTEVMVKRDIIQADPKHSLGHEVRHHEQA